MRSAGLSSLKRARAGFSLVEVVVALTLLMLLVGLAGKVVRVKDAVIENLEEPLEIDPDWFLVRDPDALTRSLGMPASLSDVPPAPGGAVGGRPGPGPGPGNGGGGRRGRGGRGGGRRGGGGGGENITRDIAAESATVRFVQVRNR